MRETKLTPLKPEFLPEKTRKMYERLSEDPLLEGFTLIGGSALTLQIGHRISEDLDFNFFGAKLPTQSLRALMENLEEEGFPVTSLITDAEKVQFRINHGEKIDDLIQDYMIGGSKITFHSRKSPERPLKQIRYLQSAKRASGKSTPGFSILGMDGLFAMKTLVLADRVKSRDLFDLMILTRDYGYSFEDLHRIFHELQPINERDIERCKSALTGILPLDKNDEGFENIGLDVKIKEIYYYFTTWINQHETKLTQDFLTIQSHNHIQKEKAVHLQDLQPQSAAKKMAHKIFNFLKQKS